MDTAALLFLSITCIFVGGAGIKKNSVCLPKHICKGWKFEGCTLDSSHDFHSIITGKLINYLQEEGARKGAAQQGGSGIPNVE